MRRSFFCILSCVLVIVLFAGGRAILSVYGHRPEPADTSTLGVADPLDPKRLPLGDGKYSTAPRRGYVMRCGNGPGFFGGGAFKDGDWIHSDGTWDATNKPIVPGDVEWKNFRYQVTVENDKRKLAGNGLPNHHTGEFPIEPGSEAFQYDRNPNHINEREIVFELPLTPQIASAPSCLAPGAIGVMKTGVAIFDGLDAQGKDAPAHEIQDKCSGHPERSGQYHYHNLSNCIAEKQTGKHSELVGYALDGFGIYGLYGEDGKELTDAGLDECHGHSHEILWDGQKINMYHYHATREYPYTMGCFRGTPAVSRNRPPRGGMMGLLPF